MSKENMMVYEQVRKVPAEAQKKITGGRLNGMTDINPMWRIQKLTEVFGMVGVGWYPEIVSERLERGSDGEVTAHTNINLYVRVGVRGVQGARHWRGCVLAKGRRDEVHARTARTGARARGQAFDA